MSAWGGGGGDDGAAAERRSGRRVHPAARYKLVRLTSACNQRCLFCNVPPGRSSDFPASFDAVKSRLMALTPADSLIISGGEPTLSRRLPEAVVCARSRGVGRIELQTNAMRMASVAFARHVGRLGFDNLLVSVHSHDPGTSDALTRAPGSFEQTLRGIANLNERSTPVTLNFVINGLNYRQLPTFVDFFLSRTDVFRPANTLSFSFIQPNGGAWDHRQTLVPRISEVVPFLVKALATCVAHGVAFAISESGIPVCFVRDYAAHHQEREKSRARILDSLIAVNVREKVKGPRCAGCVVDPHCLGVWRSYAALHGLAELTPIADDDS